MVPLVLVTLLIGSDAMRLLQDERAQTGTLNDFSSVPSEDEDLAQNSSNSSEDEEVEVNPPNSSNILNEDHQIPVPPVVEPGQDPGLPYMEQLPDRHIQYFHPGRRTMADISAFFGWLTWLGNHTNATVHLQGGLHGTDFFLNPSFTRDLAPGWSRYFDVNAPGNPFNELLPVNTMCERWDMTMDLEKMFEDGAMCLNVLSTPYEFMSAQSWEPNDTVTGPFPPSLEVLDLTRTLREELGLPAAYGFAHLRTCGRQPEMACSDPELVKSRILSFPDIDTWIVSIFAGPLYNIDIRTAFTGLNKTLVYDDDFHISRSADEYLNYEVWMQLRKQAAAEVTLHECQLEEVHLRTTEDEHQFHLKEEVGHHSYDGICKERLEERWGTTA